MRIIIYLFIFFFLPISQSWAQNDAVQPAYQQDIVVFKIRKDFKADKTTDPEPANPSARTLSRPKDAHLTMAAGLAQRTGAKRAVPAIADASPSSMGPLARRNTAPEHALERIYKLELAPGQSVEKVIQELINSGEVEYAEPYYLPELLHNPDDEFIPQQTYLNAIKAFEAWDFTQGSRDVIIGILDTGVDFNHPDLKDNLHLNLGDPIDGIDNDGDGYIDNYRGWDFGNNDNNPSADNSGHGTMVTGFSSASTNNDIGIAGTGYKCRYMPIKIFRSENDVFNNGYEAMVYAANMGCKVINLSWGAAGFRSQYVQDIINYVVLEKDVVIIAAAGNESKELNYYPASYDNVLSVTSSDVGGGKTDEKSAYATWSRYVDIMAPGNNVYTTQNGGGYRTAVGTSYAAPLVAGAAALVRSYYPDLNAQQVTERLRVSADDVSKIGSNINFHEKIGKGRLNMRKALEKDISPSVRMQRFEVFNGAVPYAFYNDTVEIRMHFKNFLSPTTNLQAEISTSSPYVTIITPTVLLGTINTLETRQNTHQPFKIYLHPDLPNNETITFRIGYSDLNYQDYQHFEFRTSAEYLDFKTDSLSLTISSNGNLGYNHDYNLNGTGFRYQNSPLAHNLGLVIAQNEKAVADNVVRQISPAIRNKDFKTLDRLKLYNNSTAYRDARSTFETIPSDSIPLNLAIEQKVLGWKETKGFSSLVIEYRLINRSDTAYKQLRAGMYSDFDLVEIFKNRADWDEEFKMGYTYDIQEKRFAGLALLSGHEVNYHALDIAARNGNTAEIIDTLKRASKYSYLANGISKRTAGTEGNGNDVAQFLGATIPALEPYKSEKVAFALLYAPSKPDLRKALTEARERYIQYQKSPPVVARLNSCPGAELTLSHPDGGEYEFYADHLGEVFIGKGTQLHLPQLYKDTAIYLAKASQNWLGDIRQIIVEVNEPLAAFELSHDTLSINPGETAMLTLTDLSINSVKWLWNFNNGYQSVKQSPKAFFNGPGVYPIELEVQNVAGCRAIIMKKVVVVYKNPAPSIPDQLLCKPGTAIIKRATDMPFTMFADKEKTDKVFEGTYFTTPVLQETTIYHASSGKGHYESDLVTVTIEVANTGVQINHTFDSTSSEKYAVRFIAQISQPQKAARTEWYINGSLKGQGEELLYPYSPDETSIQAQAITYYNYGCHASSTQLVKLDKAPVPEIAPLNACLQNEICVRPKNDGLYYFYSDPETQTLLKKGREYTTLVTSENQTLWVTNGSLGQESEAVAISLIVQANIAGFNVSTDIIAPGKPVVFSSYNSETISWNWNFGNGITSREKEAVQIFEEEGLFTVSLTALSTSGCEETFSQTVTVSSLNSLKKDEDRPGNLTIFPNPVEDKLYFMVPPMHEGKSITITDMSGRTILTRSLNGNGGQLAQEVSHLSPAWYLVRLQTAQTVFQARFVKR